MDSPAETRLEITDDSCEWSENSLEETSSGLDQSASSPVTPQSDRIHVALSFGNGSSDVSPNHESDSSYSELDSEAEAFYSSLNHQLVSSGSMDSHELGEKPMSYSELMKKVAQYEEELRTKNLKLQDSEQEIEKLKGESEKRESDVLLAELEAARREIETKDTDIETEKRRTLELQRQVVDLESQLSDSRFNVGNLVDELQVSRECVDASDAEISKLEQKFSTEKTKLESDISGLLEKQTFFEAYVREIESRSELLEDQIRRSDAEKMEMKSKEVKLEAEINALKTNLASRDEHMEALNKEFDKHKLRYDMLMAEKDGVCAEVNNLKAEMRSRDIHIEQMKEQLNQLIYRQTELLSDSGKDKNSIEELRAMVEELEKQAELQRNVISEGEEEKREAIRQLCFSLDHYKSGYRQLLRFLSSNGKAITGNHGRVI